MSQMKHCTIFYQNQARQTFKNTDFIFFSPKLFRGFTILKIREKN